VATRRQRGSLPNFVREGSLGAQGRTFGDTKRAIPVRAVVSPPPVVVLPGDPRGRVPGPSLADSGPVVFSPFVNEIPVDV
jgi:hypothetical protein